MLEREQSQKEPRGPKREHTLWATVLFFALLPVSAFGQAPGTPAGFEIDGTQICQDNGGDDWADNLAVPCNGEVDPPVPFTGAQFTDCNWGNQGDGGDSTQFKGHSNKNNDLIGAGQSPWNWASQGGGPQKNDLTNIYVHRRVEAGNEWLFVGAETRSTSGDSHIDFEVNQAGVVLQGGNLAVGCVHGQTCCDLNPNEDGNIIGNGPVGAGGRTVNDIILSMDFVQGGVQPVLTVRTWDGAQYNLVVGVAGVTLFSQTNTSDINSGTNWDGFKSNGATNAGTVKALQFVEGAINLTALGIEFDPCSTDATLMVKTRSSHSFTAELKDFALFPFPVPPFPTCIPEDDEVCDGDDAQLCATIDAPAGNLTAPFTMVWIDPSGVPVPGGTFPGLVDGDTRCIDIPGADATDAGAYTVEITDIRDCTPETCMPVLTVNPEPTADAGTDEAECEVDGTDPTLGGSPTASGGTPGYTYAWTGSCQPFLDNATAANPVFDLDAAGPGTYDCCVEVTDSNGCKDDDRMDVTVNEEPTCTVEPALVCAGEEMCAVPNGGTAPYTFQWSSGEVTQCITPATEGFFTVTVTDFNGCPTDCQGEAQLCGQACSPGFWRNNLQEWCDFTPFNPAHDGFCENDPAGTTFLVAFGLGASCDGAPSDQEAAIESGLTLHEAVDNPGGDNQTLFHCSAALLNAHAVNFPAGVTEVEQVIQDACSGVITWTEAFNTCAGWNAVENDPNGCCPFSNCP
ncbi:MAG: hypothetical protein O7D91_20140 [Planctomycetota bacterium]|nr:hypothetical protein [Planctomycetota bacterium]